MALVEAQQAFLNLTEAVADAGYGLQSFKDVPTEKVFEVLHKAGYSEVVTDGGQIMWTKPWWNTSGATSTATAGETMGQNLVSKITTEAGSGAGLVNMTASSVGFTTEAASVTEGISMIASTPKLAKALLIIGPFPPNFSVIGTNSTLVLNPAALYIFSPKS